jgi:hypothetical protein
MKRIDFDADHAARLFAEGKSISAIAAEVGTSRKAVRDALAKQGIETGNKAPRKLSLNSEEIVSRYSSGESELAIAKSLSVPRSSVRRVILESGITPRGGSEANTIRMERIGPEGRMALVENAHKSIRGRGKSESFSVRGAKGRERAGWVWGSGEALLADWLKQRGFRPVPQQAINRYNIDLGIFPLAVEIYTAARNPANNPALRKRREYILDAGWSVIEIWVTKRNMLTEFVVDHVVSCFEEAQRLPPGRGQYWMVGGGGQRITPRGGYRYDAPLVPSSVRALNSPSLDH